MGLWVSKFGAGVPIFLEEELVVDQHHLRLVSEEEPEHHARVDIPATEAPILLHLANAVEEVSEMRQSAKQDETDSLAISSSQTTLGIENAQQMNEEPANGSRHPPLALENDGEREFKTGRKFAYWSGSISYTGAMGLIGARVGNLATNVNKVPFYICTTSMASAFIISMLLLIFTRVCPASRKSARIIKCTQCLIVGLFTLAIGFGLVIVR